MTPKIIISIIVGVAIMQITSCTSMVGNSDHTLSSKTEDSPHDKNRNFDHRGKVLDMSFTEYVSTTWDFLFTGNHRTPEKSFQLNK
jgi:hypothetical protein